MTRQDFQSLIESLGQTPDIARELVSSLAGHEVTWKPSEKEYSALEHICHLNDIEREGYTIRIEKLLRENHPFMPDVDGNKLAAERDYNRRDLETALHSLTLARRNNVEIIRDLPPDQLNRDGILEGAGTITLETLLRKMLEHDRDHLQQLSDLRDRLSKEGRSPA